MPGALEIPLALQKLAATGRFDALVALGAVIRGETYHFEVVSNESASGVMTVQLDTGVPVANGILTTDNDDQAAARMQEKGADCARVAVEMANLLRQSMKNSRRRAREFALQAHLPMAAERISADTLLAQFKEQKDFPKADQALVEALLRGVIGNADALRLLITPYLDREMKDLSPVEHALLLLSAFELRDHPETPYRVMINEAIELAKSFGGTDGHKYVNGVLDKLAAELRPTEVGLRRAQSI